MSTWSEICLGVIALATLAMAVVQIGVLVAAGLAARRIGRLVDYVELELKPIFGHLNSIGRDASRAAAVATAQVERVDRLFADLAKRADDGLNAFQAGLQTPVREGQAILSALKAAARAVRERRTRRPRGDEEDALFI